MRHVDLGFLRQCIRRELPAEGALRELLDHLAASCPECGETLGGLDERVRGLVRTRLGVRSPGPPVGHRADLRAALPDPRTVGALDGLEAEAGDWIRRVRAERKRARGDLRLLCRLDPEVRAERIRSARSRFRSRAFAELLLEEVRRRCRTEPGEAAELAELVPLAVLWIPGSEGLEWARTLELRAAAWRANALRVAGEIRRADRAFAALDLELSRQVAAEPMVLAEAASLEASLRIDQRQWASARELLDRSDAFLRLEGTSSEVAKVAIKRGVVAQHCGDVAAAAGCYRQALEQLDPTKDAHVFLCALSNLSLVLCDDERYGDAERLLAEHEPVYRAHQDSWSRPREHWLRGRIAAGAGRPQEAERYYLEARNEYVAAGEAFHIALLSLDLAVLYVEQGRSSELKQVARLMREVFAAMGLADRALAALALFQQAVAAETVTVAALRAWRRQVAREERVGGEVQVA